MNDIELTIQELLDITIYSYKLSRKKLKSSSKLHIVCRKKTVSCLMILEDDFYRKELHVVSRKNYFMLRKEQKQ